MIARCIIHLVDRLLGDALDDIEDFIKEVASQ